MDFHSFGNKENPIMLLIHGVLTPWQIWDKQIEHFSKSYYIIAVALEAHTDKPSEFISIEDEVSNLENYFANNNISTIDVVCGLSLGGAIAHILWKNNKIKINNLILDGAPLTPCGGLLKNIMISSYKSIISKSQTRDKKIQESFKRDFLPEKYWQDYLKIADNMTTDSIKNLITSVSNSKLCTTVENKSNILFIHGSKGNEMLSKKSAKEMKKHYQNTTIEYCKGCTHCFYALFEPDKWIKIVQDFLNNSSKK